MFQKNNRASKELFEWNPYPQTKPLKSGQYLVSIKKIWKDWQITDRRRVCEFNFSNQPWSDLQDYEKVVAWAEIPEPYQKEK